MNMVLNTFYYYGFILEFRYYSTDIFKDLFIMFFISQKTSPFLNGKNNLNIQLGNYTWFHIMFPIQGKGFGGKFLFLQ